VHEHSGIWFITGSRGAWW